jgi:superfamily II DNA/RNA helicase
VFQGGLGLSERIERLAGFQRENRGVFVATRAGTEGLNLQFCNRLVNYELPWNPMVVEQRIGRIHGGEKLEKSLSEAFLGAETEAEFERFVSDLGTKIEGSREEGFRQEEAASLIAPTDNAALLERTFHAFDHAGRLRFVSRESRTRCARSSSRHRPIACP